MKSAGFLVAERALAQHSDQLAARPPEPAELAAALAAMAPRLERALAEQLLSLLGEDRPQVTCAKVEKIAAQKLHKIVDQVAVNYLLADGAGGEVLATLDFANALVLTDQIFGGKGHVPAHLPDRLPAATNLSLASFAQVLGKALGTVFEQGDPLSLARHSDVLGKIIPAREVEPLFLLRCEVTQEDRLPWQVLLVLRQRHVAHFLAEGRPGANNPAPGDRRRPDAAPFARMPMPLTAVLAEMRLPVSRISNLKPGDMLPLPIGGQVPLRLGDVEIARGQVGSSEGSLALRLTRIAWNEKELNHDG